MVITYSAIFPVFQHDLIVLNRCDQHLNNGKLSDLSVRYMPLLKVRASMPKETAYNSTRLTYVEQNA